MLSLIFVSLLGAALTEAPAQARGHGCLVREREILSSEPAGATCQIVQEPELSEGLFTFPYLGTRSYRVRYWKAEAVQVQYTTSTFVSRTYDRCRGWLVDKDYGTETSSVSRRFVLENPNLDERIDDEGKLLPVSEDAMKALWKKALDRCGYSG